MSKHIYTHTDEFGMRWRVEGTRYISELADDVMDAVLKKFPPTPSPPNTPPNTHTPN